MIAHKIIEPSGNLELRCWEDLGAPLFPDAAIHFMHVR